MEDFPNDVTFLIAMDCSYVYALCDADEVVYVGITSDLVGRIRQHRATRRKCPEFYFNRVLMKECASRLQAQAEERRLIRLHQPKHNDKGIPKVEADVIGILGLTVKLPEPTPGFQRRC